MKKLLVCAALLAGAAFVHAQTWISPEGEVYFQNPGLWQTLRDGFAHLRHQSHAGPTPAQPVYRTKPANKQVISSRKSQ